MRIALVSFEYSGANRGGGIGTYMRQTASMLAARGHDVEVFIGDDTECEGSTSNVRIIRVEGPREEFAQNVLAPFLARHRCTAFDVVEGAEFGADLLMIMEALPNLARVVKLHTASYQISLVNDRYLTLGSKARFLLGGLRRGRLPRPFWGHYVAENDNERRIVLAADEVTSPSKAQLDFTMQTWPIDPAKTAVIPHVFDCDPAVLKPARASGIPYVTFIGRLEVRKGIVEFARAIPAILHAVPEARFRVIGRTLPYPATGEPLDAVVLRAVGPLAKSCIEFTGPVPQARVYEFLSYTAVSVFPSYWEAYGLACIEAMATATAVIGSRAGGMAEIIEEGRTGLLVPPRNPRAIAAAIIELLENPDRRIAMGRAAREHVVNAYSPERIGPLQEASYERAIERARARRANANG